MTLTKMQRNPFTMLVVLILILLGGYAQCSYDSQRCAQYQGCAWVACMNDQDD